MQNQLKSRNSHHFEKAGYVLATQVSSDLELWLPKFLIFCELKNRLFDLPDLEDYSDTKMDFQSINKLVLLNSSMKNKNTFNNNYYRPIEEY